MKHKIVFYSIFIVLLFSFYQDFPLVNSFGEIARCPIIFISPFLLYYSISNRRSNLSEDPKKILYYIAYVFLISIIYTVIVIFQNNYSLIVLDENIIFKTLRMSIYPITSFILYWFFYNFFFNNKNSIEILYKAFKLLQIIFAIILFLEICFYKTDFAFLSLLHSNNQKYRQIRLLTYEESWTGTIIILLVFLPLYLSRILQKNSKEKKNIYILSSLILISYSLVSESKGFLLLTLISIIPLLIKSFLKEKKLKKFRTVFLSILSVIVLFFCFNFYHIISRQLYISGTFGTRFTSILASLNLFLQHPFGVGWSGMIYYYPKEIESMLNSDILNHFNLNEIKQYTFSVKSLSTKTYFLDELMQGGIIFIIFYYSFFLKKYIKLIKQSGDIFLKIILLYIILAGIIYITYNIKYEVWFFMAFLEFILSKNKEIIVRE